MTEEIKSGFDVTTESLNAKLASLSDKLSDLNKRDDETENNKGFSSGGSSLEEVSADELNKEQSMITDLAKEAQNREIERAEREKKEEDNKSLKLDFSIEEEMSEAEYKKVRLEAQGQDCKISNKDGVIKVEVEKKPETPGASCHPTSFQVVDLLQNQRNEISH